MIITILHLDSSRYQRKLYLQNDKAKYKHATIQKIPFFHGNRPNYSNALNNV